jgi:hypothetical protein
MNLMDLLPIDLLPTSLSNTWSACSARGAVCGREHHPVDGVGRIYPDSVLQHQNERRGWFC